MTKEYLGDSVYVDNDGWGITLTTENGYGPSNTIYLEPDVLRNLDMYREQLKKLGESDDTTRSHH